MSKDFLEVYGTIASIGPIESGGLQKLKLINANTVTVNAMVDDRLMVHVQQTAYAVPLSFELNTPLVARGLYVQSRDGTPSYVHGTYGYGFIRYKGRIYK